LMSLCSQKHSVVVVGVIVGVPVRNHTIACNMQADSNMNLTNLTALFRDTHVNAYMYSIYEISLTV
jgi:hypothetical protein